jgi:uncharacterized protein YkwD
MNRLVAAAFAACLSLTCTPASAGTGFERDVLAEINRVRADPQGYAEELRDYRRWFEGKLAHFPNGFELNTTEGVSAVDEAIAFLEHQAPLPPLAPGEVLALAARDHADEQEGGAIGHRSPNGMMPGDRVKLRGGDIYVGETIAYGPHDAVTVVRQFIVDDGVARRGHRALVFSNMFRFAGVGCGGHAIYGNVCVVDYSATPDGRPQLPHSASR